MSQVLCAWLVHTVFPIDVLLLFAYASSVYAVRGLDMGGFNTYARVLLGVTRNGPNFLRSAPNDLRRTHPAQVS